MKENIEEDIKIVQEFLIEQNKRNQRLIDNPYRQLFYTDEEVQAIENILSDYKRVLKENEELLQEKIDNQKIIALAQNEFLGYEQGYQDGKVGRRSATQAIIEGQQYYIIQEQFERYKNQIEKLQKENEELKHKYDKALSDVIAGVDLDNTYISKQKIKGKIEEYKKLGNEFYEKFLETNKTDINIHDAGIACDSKVQALQELLEEKGE